MTFSPMIWLNHYQSLNTEHEAHHTLSAQSLLMHHKGLLLNSDKISWNQRFILQVEIISCILPPAVTTMLSLLTRGRVCWYSSWARGCIPIAPRVWPLWGWRGGHRHREGRGEVLGSLHGYPGQQFFHVSQHLSQVINFTLFSLKQTIFCWHVTYCLFISFCLTLTSFKLPYALSGQDTLKNMNTSKDTFYMSTKGHIILPIIVRPLSKYRGPRRGIGLHRGQGYCSLLPCCTLHLPWAIHSTHICHSRIRSSSCDSKTPSLHAGWHIVCRPQGVGDQCCPTNLIWEKVVDLIHTW